MYNIGFSEYLLLLTNFMKMKEDFNTHWMNLLWIVSPLVIALLHNSITLL